MESLYKENSLITMGTTLDFSASGKSNLRFSDYLLETYESGLTSRNSNTRLVCIDYHPKSSKTIKALGLNRANCVLVRTEPRMVVPSNFSKRRHQEFGDVITLGAEPDLSDHSMPWPQVWPEGKLPVEDGQVPRLEKVVSISGNKVSLISGELYSLRRQCIEQLSSVDFFGRGWGSSFPARLLMAIKSFAFAVMSLSTPHISGLRLWFSKRHDWLGEVQDKRRVMSNYKYALVIENSQKYMSEKLFDAFFAGCIPIYVGPPVERYGIPESLVIQAKPDVRSVQAAVVAAKSKSYEDWRMNLEGFLGKESTREKWSHVNVYHRLAQRVLYTSK
jgi:hypothetical protein